MGSHIAYQRHWGDYPAEFIEEIAFFWESQGLLPKNVDPAQRAKQVVFTARDTNHQIIGVSTAFKYFSNTLDQHLLYYRSLVAREYRNTGASIGKELMLRSYKLFDSMTQKGALDGCIGMFTEVENAIIHEHKTEAVWPVTQFVHIGHNKKGQDMRVRYFQGANIQRTHTL